MTRNGNPEYLSCEHADKWVMEFWKDNREGDDRFGGKRYVEWLLSIKSNVMGLLGPKPPAASLNTKKERPQSRPC